MKQVFLETTQFVSRTLVLIVLLLRRCVRSSECVESIFLAASLNSPPQPNFEMEEEAFKDPVLRRAETAGLQNHYQ
jgi:hypothetical protein